MKLNKMQRLFIVVLVMLFAAGISVPAFAERGIDLQRKGSITMSCTYEGSPVQGGDLGLYCVAGVEEEDGSYYFRLRSDLLGGERLDQSGLDDPDLAARLASAPALGDPDQTAVFDQQGLVVFSDLEPGLYLLMQSNAAEGYEKMLPVLVSLPWYDSAKETYIYDIDATVKPEVERTAEPTPPPGDLPQTGQLNWPVPVLAAAGMMLLILGIMLLTAERHRKRN